MLTILTETDSVASHYLYEMRSKDIQNDRARFRNNMKRLGFVMGMELSRKLTYADHEVETPLGYKKVRLLKESPVLITILRAGNPFLLGFEEVFESSDVGFIGAFRKHEGTDMEVALNYQALPDTTDREVLLIDPMLATGQSMIQAYEAICESGIPSKVYFMAVVASPEGISYVQEHCKHNFEIWTGGLDERLNEMAYIVPGLGDAGDLSYGKKI